MQIKQFEDKNLSHFSYAFLSETEKKVVLVDPARNPQPYLDYAKEKEAQIVGIIETHPHADFVSGHLEISQHTGAKIHVHSLVGASYPHQVFDDGNTIEIGETRFTSLHTPGHSPDSISILAEENGKQVAVFTGDTLFIGDCGRPDLREGAGNIQLKKEDLAAKMYHSLRNKLMVLNSDVIVYPAHGAGTLCGKNLSAESRSTIGQEKLSNWSLQPASEEEFVASLLADQPLIPAYFPYDVETNRKGAPSFAESIAKISDDAKDLDLALWIVDARSESEFKKGHLPHSINLMEDGKFETWLGSIIKPGEKFYLVVEDKGQRDRLLARIAAIGYEGQVNAAFVNKETTVSEDKFDLDAFRKDTSRYTIVDVRNPAEVKLGQPFANSLAIPLYEIRERVGEIPTDKPIVVHCAAGYRSAAASSIIKSRLNGNTKVYDLSMAIKDFPLTSA